MITEAQRAEIRRLFYAEHWRIGTIARALASPRYRARRPRDGSLQPTHPRSTSALDPYTDFIRATLEQYPSSAPPASTR